MTNARMVACNGQLPSISALLRRHIRQSPVAIRAALEFLGHEHVLLGSDAPFIAPRDHLATLARLGLSEEKQTLLTSGNARRVLGV